MTRNTLLGVTSISDPFDSAKPLLEAAFESDSHLNLVVLGITRTLPESIYVERSTQMWEMHYQEINKNIKIRIDELETTADSMGASLTLFPECQETPFVAEVMSQYALYADATLIPHGSMFERGSIGQRAFQGALFKARQSVLVLGKSVSPFPCKRVMIAWDPVTECVQALHSSLRFIKKSEDVRVVVVNPDSYREGPNPGDDIATYIARQDLPVTVERLPDSGRQIADVIKEHAIDMDADLLVMGGYGHSRMREWLLGGTTHSILTNYDKSVLMAN